MSRAKAPNRVSYFDLLEALRIQMEENPQQFETPSTFKLMRELAVKQALVEERLDGEWIIFYPENFDGDNFDLR